MAGALWMWIFNQVTGLVSLLNRFRLGKGFSCQQGEGLCSLQRPGTSIPAAALWFFPLLPLPELFIPELVPLLR